MATSARLWILEGPDGSGKSVLAASLAAATGADVVHLGPFPRVSHGLGRLYVEAMTPALRGYRDVILDRSWLSEPVYAQARRHARSRLTPVDLRLLERVAARCRTTVVRCLPPLTECALAWAARRGTEYLATANELAEVWGLYAVGLATGLPTVDFDYTKQGGTTVGAIDDFAALTSTTPHQLGVASAGYLDAPVLLVGERFAEHADQDSLLQHPFVSFSDGGCSRWLTAQLNRAGIAERSLLWANADQNLVALLFNARPKVVVALGEVAARALADLKVPNVVQATHPQYAKRFRHSVQYDLITTIRERLS